MNYEERIPLNSLLSSPSQRSSHESSGNRINSRPFPITEGSLDILEHLISIVLQGNLLYLEKLLKNDEVLDVIDMQDNKGFTALHIACDKYDPDCTRLLLQAGADPNIPDRYKRTALHWVVNGGCRCEICNTKRAKCTELLVAARVNLEGEDYEGETALYYAARNALHKPAAVMLENGAEISKCVNGVTLGHLIVQKIPEVMVQILDASIAYDDQDNSKLKIDFGVLIDASKKDDEIEIEETKHSVRDSNGKPRKETDLLGYMMNAHPFGREALLMHPVTQAFLHLKWINVRHWFWCTRIFYCFLTLIYTYFIFDLYIFTCPYYKTWTIDGKNEEFKCTYHYKTYILSICIGGGLIVMIMNQFYKFFMNICNYFKSGFNFGWWILFASITFTIIPPLEIGIEIMEWHYPVAAIGIFYSWSMNLVHLNHIPYFGVYIEMLWKIFRKVVIISATFSSLFIAFALGFCLLFPQINFFNDIPKSIVKSILMMLGDRDYPPIFDQLEEKRLGLPHYTIPVHIFYFGFLITFGVVIMNLILALAVSDVQKLQENAEIFQICRQITEIAVLESFAVSKCLSSCFTRCILSRISVRSRNGRYFSFSPSDPDDKSFPTKIKTKLIPYMKSRPCLNKEKIRRPLFGINQSFMHKTGGPIGRSQTPFRSQENLDDILNDLKNRLEGLNYKSSTSFMH